MAEQLLDDPQVRAAVEQVRRERVAERMRRDADRQAGPGAQPVEPVAQAADPERFAVVVQEDLGRRRPVAGPALQQHRPAVVEVVGQRGPGRAPEEPDPLLAALAEDPDLAAPEIERTELGGGQLADPQAGRVGRLDQGPVAQRERRAGARRGAGSPTGRAARSASTTPSSRPTCSTSRTRGSRRGRRGVAIEPQGSPGASSFRVAQRWNARIAASRWATVVLAWPSPSTAR